MPNLISYNSNTPVEEMWVMVSSLQFLSFLPLIKLFTPGNLQIFLDYLNQVHNYNSNIPNVFKYLLITSDIPTNSYNAQFESHGIASMNMLMLVGSDVELLIGSLVVLFFVELFITPNP